MQLQYNSVEGGTPEEHSWADPTIPKKAANKKLSNREGNYTKMKQLSNRKKKKKTSVVVPQDTEINNVC